MIVYVSYSISKMVAIPDDWSDKEINDYLDYIAPEGYDNMIYDVEEN